MVLPNVPDAVLVEELRKVITAGWRLMDRPKWRGRIRHLLSMVNARPEESHSAVVGRLLRALDAALQDNTIEPVGDSDEPLLTDDVATGLRILFGLHPDYRWTTVMTRRAEGGHLILGRIVLADTFYNTYEEEAARMTLECLRVSYGQEVSIDRRYDSVRRYTLLTVGSERQKAKVEIANTHRARADGLDSIRSWFYLDTEPRSVSIHSVWGVDEPAVEEPLPAKHRLTFPLLRPLSNGEEFAWGFTRSYEYPPDAMVRPTDRMAIFAANDNFEVGMTVRFDCSPPAVVWWFAEPRLRYPGRPTPELLLSPDNTNKVSLPEIVGTNSRRAYGIAWEW